MNKEQLIKSKLVSIQQQIKNTNRYYDIVKVLSILIGGVAFGMGVPIALTTPLASLPFFATLASAYTVNKQLKALTTSEIKSLELEKKHLESVKDKKLKDSQELNKKRKKKINELERAKKKAKKRSRRALGGWLAVGTAVVVGAVLGTFNPLALIASGVGLVGMNSTRKSLDNLAQKELRLNARINNLKNDLDIINSSQQEHTNSSLSQNKSVKQPQKQSSATKLNNKSSISNKMIEDDSIEKNLAAINAYIYNLEQQKEAEKAKYKVKH